MKIFGSVFPFVEPSENSDRMGRYVANYEFLVALLNYSSFERFHLFCLNPSHMQATVERLSNDESVSTSAKSKVDVFLLGALNEQLQTASYHCFHLGGWGYFFSGLVSLRNRNAQEPFPITGLIHSLNARETASDCFKLVKARLRAYDAIVCTSAAGQQVLEKKISRIVAMEGVDHFNGAFRQIVLGVNSGFDDIPAQAESRERLGIDKKTKVILYIGRISPVTKADLYPLLLVMQGLRKKHVSSIKLIIAGGAEQSQLTMHEEMVTELGLDDCVQIIANFEAKYKKDLYCSADICVAPSDNIQETFGISIIEAMACGIPVVASDLNGYKESIIQGETGFKVKTTWIDQFDLADIDELMPTDTLQTLLAQSMVIDLDEMEGYIEQLLADDQLRMAMGEAAKQRVKKYYRWEFVISEYEKMWDQLKLEAMSSTSIDNSPSLFSNDYLQSFSHFPSEQLSSSHRVVITHRGQEALSSGKLPQYYSDCAMAIDDQWLSDVCNFLQLSGAVGVEVLFDKFGDKNTKGRFSLLWAAKYGLVKLLDKS